METQLVLTQMAWPFSPRLLARCYTAAQPVHANNKPEVKELKEIGHRVRVWRIQAGKSRAALAKELNMDMDLLLVLEMGDALPEDITKQQLTQLSAMMSQSCQGKEFNTLLRKYMERFHE